ncbi:MAG: periplasmic heavy metal sensor [Saprospiraceae bacterium]|nr:periplasmic heavy metal sensor [Saprospiraceae bacterium]
MTNLKNLALVALLLMNIVLVIMLWVQPMPHEKMARMPEKGTAPPPRRAEGFLVKALNLNEEQRVQLKTLRDEHFEFTREIHQRGRTVKKEMFDALLSSVPDTSAALQFAAEYGGQLQKIDEALIQHYLDIRAICTPEQQEELRKVFRKAIRRPRPR